jgi:hypothetical protein
MVGTRSLSSGAHSARPGGCAHPILLAGVGRGGNGACVDLIVLAVPVISADTATEIALALVRRVLA